MADENQQRNQEGTEPAREGNTPTSERGFNGRTLDNYANFRVGAGNKKLLPYAAMNGLMKMNGPDAMQAVTPFVDAYLEAEAYIKQHYEAMERGEDPKVEISPRIIKIYTQLNDSTKIFSEKFIDTYNGLTVGQALEYNTWKGRTTVDIPEKVQGLLEGKKDTKISDLEDTDLVKHALDILTDTKIDTRFYTAAVRTRALMNFGRLEESLNSP